MKSGFTLIELVVVMFILGILAAVAVTKLSKSDEGAYISSMKADLKNTLVKTTLVYSQEQSYPDDFIINSSGTKTGNIPFDLKVNNTPTKVIVTTSPFNIVDFKFVSNGCGTDNQILINVSNPEKTPTIISYDSCTDASLK